MKLTRVCILGGTGFVGRHLAKRLSLHGLHLRIPTRFPHRHRDLQLIEGVQLLPADLHNPTELASLFEGCGVVINLVGILNERDHAANGFDHLHVELARKVINACQEKGIRHLLHMSALRAENTSGTSRYLRSKAQAETLVHTLSGPSLAVTSMRPALIFGPGGDFLERISRTLKSLPLVVPLACGQSRFQPVYVGDVADVFVEALSNKTLQGAKIDLCGPKTYTLHELASYIIRLQRLRRLIIDLPDWIARVEARILERMPGKVFTMDNYQTLLIDNVCTGGSRYCHTTLESVAPQYLGQNNMQNHYGRLRDLSQY